MSAIQPPTASKAQLPTASTLQRQLNFPTASTLIKSFDDHVNGKFGSSLNVEQPTLSLNAQQPTLSLNAAAAPALTSKAQLPTSSKAQLPTASTLQKQFNFPTASTLIKSFDDHVNGKFGSSLNVEQPTLSLNAQQPTLSLNAAAAPALTSKAQLPTSSKAQLPTASTLQKQFNFPTASTLIKSFDDHVNGKFGSSLLNAQQQTDASPAAPAASIAPAQQGNFQLPTSSSLERQLNLPTSSSLFKKFNDQSGGQFGSTFNAQQPALSFAAAAPVAPSAGAVPPPDCPCHLKKLLNQTPAQSAAPAQADFSAQFSQTNFGNNQSFGNFDLNSFSNNNQLPQSFGGNFNFGSNNFGSLF